MLHPFSKTVTKTLRGVLGALLLLVACLITPHAAQTAEDLHKILSLQSKVTGNETEIRLQGDSPFVSSVYELPKPVRVVVDVANAVLAENFILPGDTPFRVATTKVAGTNPVITRFEIYVPELVSFASRQEGKDTILTIESKDSPQAAQQADFGVVELPKTTFTGLSVETGKGETRIHLDFDGQVLRYQKDITPKNPLQNPQLILDIDQVQVDDKLLASKMVNTSVEKIVTVKRGSGLRVNLVSSSNTLFPYTITKTEKGIEVVVKEAEGKDQVSTIIGQHRNIESQLPTINPLEAKLSPQAREQQMQDAFNFSGYNKERISVEFQKMDLHNVFNFLRQVSGINIVVDESVNGSLTLVLDDVPWDFALDIILNLKGLEKEERFNTLVIYPKGKGFKWPEQAENNLSFEADSAVIEKEALVIQQQERQSEEVVEAKQIIARGLKAEKRKDFETAVGIYEQALEKWRKNVELANKISAIYLVQLQQNAKAMYFSQQALKIDPKNEIALLHAGIACANMLDTSKADQYFARSVQAKKPMRESLLNYAAFKEEHNAYTPALSLLERHDLLYGKSLDSMIAAARISDKMGNTRKANKLYQGILTSGFRLPPDLAKYIQGRVAQQAN
nr:secretin and TonB N-terminal domain-containing protein [uncultured Desulfobulbus sp.]